MASIAKMAKGEAAFDAAAVLTTLQALQANEAKVDIDALFPAGSDKGDTKASPKIWEDMAGFKAANDKYKADLDAAVAKPATSVEALGAQLGVLGGDCGGCHKALSPALGLMAPDQEARRRRARPWRDRRGGGSGSSRYRNGSSAAEIGARLGPATPSAASGFSMPAAAPLAMHARNRRARRSSNWPADLN